MMLLGVCCLCVCVRSGLMYLFLCLLCCGFTDREMRIEGSLICGILKDTLLYRKEDSKARELSLFNSSDFARKGAALFRSSMTSMLMELIQQ